MLVLRYYRDNNAREPNITVVSETLDAAQPYHPSARVVTFTIYWPLNGSAALDVVGEHGDLYC